MSRTRGVESFTRSSRSRKIVPISVELIRFWKLLFVTASSSILIFSSWLTVVSSSLTDCSSSLLVSSSSAADRSSSLVACSSSFDAFASSTWVSYCSTVARSCAFNRSSSSSSCCAVSVVSGPESCTVGGATVPASDASCSRNRTRKNPRAGSSWSEDGPHAEVIRRGWPSIVTSMPATSTFTRSRRARIERCPQFDPQLGPDQPHQVAREIAAADLQVLGGALRHVHHLVLLGHND